MKQHYLVLVWLTSMCPATQSLGQNIKVNWYVFSSGFGLPNSSTATVKTSIGQGLTGLMQQGNTWIASGFLADTLLRGTVVSVDQPTSLPGSYELLQNYPNPFNPTTTIRYQLPERTFVTMHLFNVLGEEVARLVNEERPAGVHDVPFNGARFSSGVYFYTLRAGGFVQTRKLMILK
jgi:hypothetical protein